MWPALLALLGGGGAAAGGAAAGGAAATGGGLGGLGGLASLLGGKFSMSGGAPGSGEHMPAGQMGPPTSMMDPQYAGAGPMDYMMSGQAPDMSSFSQAPELQMDSLSSLMAMAAPQAQKQKREMQFFIHPALKSLLGA